MTAHEHEHGNHPNSTAAGLAASSLSGHASSMGSGGAFDVDALVGALAAAVVDRLADAAASSVPDDGRLLDAKQAGLLLGLPPSWLLTEAKAGRIPHVRFGKYVRFSRPELDAWVEARMSGPRRRTGADPVSRRRGAA